MHWLPKAQRSLGMKSKHTDETQIPSPEGQPNWLDLPVGVVHNVLQQLHSQDALHALLACKQWAGTAGALSYALEKGYDEDSPAYDMPGIAWLLRHSKRVARLTLRGDSGAACGTLQALQWDNLQQLVLHGPADSFAAHPLFDEEIEKAVRDRPRMHIIRMEPDFPFCLCATHPFERLPNGERVPCLERLVIINYALLDWRFPRHLVELELTLPSTGTDWEDTDGVMWGSKLEALQPLPLLERLCLSVPLNDTRHFTDCFATPNKVWPRLVSLSIIMLHRDTQISDAVFSVASLPQLQRLAFASVIEADEWHALFCEGDTWDALLNLEIEADENVDLQLDTTMFPNAKLVHMYLGGIQAGLLTAYTQVAMLRH